MCGFMLAGQNALPGAAGIGFELFDKTNYGMTEFMQNINYKRAIQGELSTDHKSDAGDQGIPGPPCYSRKDTLSPTGKKKSRRRSS